MKKILFSAAIVSSMVACQSGRNSEPANVTPGIHAVVVEEVLQTPLYSYLRVKEGDHELWLAVQKMSASTGETYYYKTGLQMTDFVSKELNRTFKEILFLDNLSKDQTSAGKVTETTPSGTTSASPGTNEENALHSGSSVHACVAEEVLQTNQYTYIRAKEGDRELWLAVNKMEPTTGITYYFQGGLPMTDFASKELKRTFKEILFVDNISTDPPSAENRMTAGTQGSQPVSTGSAIPLERKDIKMKHAKDDITIAMLLQKKKEYSGKAIRVNGEVTKFTPGIMKKNWIHLQDGTDFSGKFDLTITTNEEVKVGDHITAEGMISLDKDFGFGYFYEVIMEDAKLVK